MSVNDTVDAGRGGHFAAPRAVMWTIAQIAERDGVSKQAVSKQVGRLVERHGLAVERDGQGRVAAVNVAEYDHLRGRYRDPSKAQAPVADAPSSPPDKTEPTDSYDEALRQKTWHEAERKRLDLELAKRALVPLAELDAAIGALSEQFAPAFDNLPGRADEIANALTRGGLHELRTVLKKIARDQRLAVADAFSQLTADIAAPLAQASTEPSPPSQ